MKFIMSDYGYVTSPFKTATMVVARGGIFKLLRSLGIDLASLICNQAGRYDNPIPTWFLAIIGLFENLSNRPSNIIFKCAFKGTVQRDGSGRN
jgi:hypothetical protein